MKLQLLADNMRRLRTARRLSQRALADAAGLSLPTVKNIEGAKKEPRMASVEAVARAMSVPVGELFAPVRQLQIVRFRSRKRMQNRENILAEVARRLDELEYLEGILDSRIPFHLGGGRKQYSSSRTAASAELCRRKLGLGADPILDIGSVLENAGVKLLPIASASEGFFGLAVGEEDGGPAVVVNVYERITPERRIFTTAHELGHILLHQQAFDAGKTDENKQEEEEADNFAGHFLMPNESFERYWHEAAGLNLVKRVFKVKGIFRVSYKTVLHRLVEKKIADETIWQRFTYAYEKEFDRKLPYKEEPEGLDGAEPFGLKQLVSFEDRARRLVRKAVEAELITVARGAEMLRISIEEMQQLLKDWETVR